MGSKKIIQVIIAGLLVMGVFWGLASATIIMTITLLSRLELLAIPALVCSWLTTLYFSLVRPPSPTSIGQAYMLRPIHLAPTISPSAFTPITAAIQRRHRSRPLY